MVCYFGPFMYLASIPLRLSTGCLPSLSLRSSAQAISLAFLYLVKCSIVFQTEGCYLPGTVMEKQGGRVEGTLPNLFLLQADVVQLQRGQTAGALQLSVFPAAECDSSLGHVLRRAPYVQGLSKAGVWSFSLSTQDRTIVMHHAYSRVPSPNT